MRILVAGAAGAIGRHLLPRLVAEGHHVVGTTRSPAKTDLLRSLGAEPLVLDGLDATAVGEGVAAAGPDVVIHQMTALAGASDLRHFDRQFAATNALRTAGTDHLLAAAVAAGARRFIAQSFAGWPNIREGGPVKTEEDPLDPHPPKGQRATLAAIRHLEDTVRGARSLDGVVLRYGGFYGPGTSDEMLEFVRRRRMPLVGNGAGVWSFVHIEDAAAATVAAVGRGEPGIYNIVDDDPAPVAEWLPLLAEALGAPPPRRIPTSVARLLAGDAAVSMMTRIRGSSNAKARAELGWTPLWPTWRDGFRRGLTGPGPATGPTTSTTDTPGPAAGRTGPAPGTAPSATRRPT